MLSLTGAKKSSSLAIRPKTSMIPAAKISNSKNTVGSKSNYLQSINVKVLEIESMITTKLIREKTKTIKDRKKAQKEDRNEQEKDLEKGKDPGKKNIKIPKVPKLGMFGWLKRFIGSVILAFFASKMIDNLPKLVGLVKGIQNVIEFVSDIGIKLVDGLATFVDWGYKAYDATQGFLKNFGVKQEQFDQFSGALSGLIDALIIGSVILAARGEDGFGPGGLDKARRPGGRKPGVTTGSGGQKPRFRNPLRRSPVTQSGKPGMPGAPVTQGRGGSKPRAPGTKPPVTGGLPKGKFKLPRIRTPRALKGAGLVGLLLLIPTLFEVGGLIAEGNWKTGLNVAISTIAGLAAASAAVSSTVGVSVAAGLTGIGIPVAIAGFLSSLVLGGLAGWAAYEGSYNLLKTLGLRDDDPELKKQGYNEGGKVRKKPSRKLKKKKRTLNVNRLRKPVYRPIPSAPQGDVENKDGTSNRAWWDFLGWAGTGNIDLSKSGAKLGTRVSEVGNTLGKNDYFGPILSLTSKIILNKDINNQDYDNVGLGINRLINEGILEKRISKGIHGYAEGGGVANTLASGIDASSWVTDTFKRELSSDIKGKYENIGVPGSTSGSTSGPGGTGTGTGTTPGSSSPSSSTTSGTGSTDVQANIQAILKAAKDANYTGDLAAVLAIAKGESGLKGIPEGRITTAERAAEVWPASKGGFTVAEAQSLLDKGGWRALYNEAYGYKGNDLGNRPGTNDGSDFMGRGFIQITGRHNYTDIGKLVGVDFLKNPDLLNDRDISARAAIAFMQRGGSPKDIESALTSVGGIKEGWPKKRRFYQEFKQQLDSGELKLGQNKPSSPNVEPGSSQPASSNIPDNISSGTGGPMVRSAKGTKLAGDLGRYIYKTLTPESVGGPGTGDFSYASEHPDFGGSFKRNYKSWHNVDRGIDIGGFWPKDQKKILAKVLEFNEKRGVQPVELLYGKPGTPESGSHYNHVHVAYEKGGMTLDGPHMAMIGEKGREIVIDNDSSVAKITPMLLAINAAKDEKGVMKAISDYAPYELGAQQTVLVNNNNQTQPMDDYDTQDQGLAVMMANSYDNSFEFLDYQG